MSDAWNVWEPFSDDPDSAFILAQIFAQLKETIKTDPGRDEKNQANGVSGFWNAPDKAISTKPSPTKKGERNGRHGLCTKKANRF